MDEFYEYFNIDKVEIQTPGRDWSDDGLSSWYIEKVYPSIEELFFDLLDFYNIELDGMPLKLENITRDSLCELLEDSILARMKQLEKEGKDLKDEKDYVKQLFEDLNSFYVEEELN